MEGQSFFGYIFFGFWRCTQSDDGGFKQGAFLSVPTLIHMMLVCYTTIHLAWQGVTTIRLQVRIEVCWMKTFLGR